MSEKEIIRGWDPGFGEEARKAWEPFQAEVDERLKIIVSTPSSNKPNFWYEQYMQCVRARLEKIYRSAPAVK